jgi:hypothetical protein
LQLNADVVDPVRPVFSTQLAHLATFCTIKSEDWVALAVCQRCLDLDGDTSALEENQEIELASANSDVAAENRGPPVLQKTAGDRLAKLPDLSVRKRRKIRF